MLLEVFVRKLIFEYDFSSYPDSLDSKGSSFSNQLIYTEVTTRHNSINNILIIFLFSSSLVFILNLITTWYCF